MKKIIIISLVLLFVSNSQAQVRIQMTKEGGVYTTPCTVNGLKLRFIFDTGASNVSISSSEAVFMLKNGYLDKEDVHGSSYSQIANGNLIKNTTVNLKELEIGGIKLINVEAVIIHELSAPLLLGQSAIQKLGKIQIEGNNLIIMNFAPSSTDNIADETLKLKKDALKYYEQKLYQLASETYLKAYELNPSGMDKDEYFFLGSALYQSDRPELAIKFLGLSIDLETDKPSLYALFMTMSYAYTELKNYDQAILNIQKAIVQTNDSKDLYGCYLALGNIFFRLDRYGESNDNYQKSLTYYLMQKPISPEEVDKGKIKDDELGFLFYQMGLNFGLLHNNTMADQFIKRSALLGNNTAIDYCRQYRIKLY
jgi:clan AA aspartic protease (TIGR02281 family)